MKQRTRLRALAIACLLFVALQAAPARANAGEEAGIGIASALCSLVYGPVKVVYATLGLVFGGMGWALSGGDADVANAVLTPAVRGDYVITPAHLRGEKSVEFFGREPEYR